MNDDGALLHRYAAGHDEVAFAGLVQRHLPLVYSAALRQLDGAAHRAEEVTQSVFIDLARKARSLSRRTELAGWLYTSTHFAAAKLKRTEQRRQLREKEATTMQELLSDSASEVDWRRLRPVLDDAMHELGDRDRDVILQRFFQGCRFAEMGEKLGLSEDAARLRTDRALEKLRTVLARRQITSTTAALALTLANQPAVALPANLAAMVTGAVLSGAAASGSGIGAPVLAFMTATKTIGTLGGVAALTIAAALYQSGQARTDAATLATAHNSYAAARAHLADLENQAQAAEQALANRNKAAAQPVATSATPKQPATAAAVEDDRAKQLQTLQQRFNNDPQLQKLRLDLVKLQFKANSGPFLRSIGLSPEQIEQAVEAYAQNSAELRTQRDAGLKPQANESLVAKFRTLFGDIAAERYAQFAKTPVAVQLVGQLSAALCYSDDPLTAQQADQLTQLFTSAQTTTGHQANQLVRDLLNAGTTSTAGMDRRMTVDWDRVLIQAEPLLSPVQLQGLRAQAALGRMERQLAAVAQEAAATPRK